MAGRGGQGRAGAAGDGGSVLLERERELEAIASTLDEAARGSGRALLLEGSAGIGKTRLADVAADHAARIGARVLRARGEELERAYPWGVVIQLFGEVIRERGPEPMRGAAELVRPLFERPAPAAAAEADLFPLIHGLHWLAADLAEGRPLVLVVDDAHDSDPESLRYLNYLLGRLEGLSLALVLAARGRRPEGEKVTELLDRLRADPATRALTVAPLSEASVEALVRRDHPDAAGRFCDALGTATGGNPFLCRELLEELREEGIEPDSEAVARLRELRPERARNSILLRLGRLGGDARRLATALAVVGPGTPTDLATAIAGLDPDAAAEVVEVLLRADLLAPGPRLEFAHPIIGEVVREDLSPARLRRDHLAVARTLHERGGPPEEISSHLLVGDRTREPWAAAALRETARSALTRGAPDRAAELLRVALESSAERSDRAETLIELGDAEASAGEPGAAERFGEALRLGPATSEVAAVALRQGEALYANGLFSEAVDAFERGLELCEEAAGAEGSEVVEARLLASLNMAAMLAGTPPGSVRPRSAELAPVPPAAPSLAERVLLAMRAGELALGAQGPLDLGREAADAAASGSVRDRVLELARGALAGGELPRELGAVVLEPITLALTFCDELAQARSILDRVLAGAGERGEASAYATLPIRGFGHLRSGRLSEAVADGSDAIRIADEVPGASRQTLAPARYVVAVASLARGEEAAAAEAVDVPDAEEQWGSGPLYGWFLDAVGRVELVRGRPERALACFRAAGERLSAAGGPGAYCDWRSGAARAAGAAGETAEAAELASEEHRLAVEFGAPRAIAIALRTRAALASEGEAAIELLGEAAATLQGSEAELERARTQVELGSALRRVGRRRDSRAPLREGMDIARRCGAMPLVERAATELEASGARRPELALSGVESLTPSELRVARMARGGMGNREIAESLFVTRKTVEVHLSNTYRKLEISSRRELPAELTDEGGPATAES